MPNTRLFTTQQPISNIFTTSRNGANIGIGLQITINIMILFFFKRSIMDNSAFLRLIRRAYSEREKQKVISSVYTQTRFVETSEEIVILRTIVKNFSEAAKKDDIIPVIYIVNSKGTGDRLYRILKATLHQYDIPYLSTHLICPPDDPNVYLIENSHFIPSKDMELATEMIGIIEKELSKKKL